ncbi:MAG TPA: DUF72 domain-containing protein [Candidatus Binatia bacterium]|nr:DUF72 domain-containing protein [Candidatus Binatia bacterium]
MAEGRIFTGIGGWIYPPWRGVFYPPELPHSRELEFASRAVTAIEINATYHRLQTPRAFASWAAAVPRGFVFTVKASRICTNRRNLADGAEAMQRFFAQGVTELGPALGPILWQLMPTKRFDPDEIRAFLALLPRAIDGVRLRHALEARHESFCNAEFVAIARKARVAIVVADAEQYPQIADRTGSFVYARLQKARAEIEAGYDSRSLGRWCRIAKEWSAGEEPAGLTYAGGGHAKVAEARAVAARPGRSLGAPGRRVAAAKAPAPDKPRDVFLFFIDGAKERAPAAARALIARLRR